MSDSILNSSRGLSVLVLCVETYWIHILKKHGKIKKSDVIYSERPRRRGWICTPLSRAWTWSSLKSNLFEKIAEAQGERSWKIYSSPNTFQVEICCPLTFSDPLDFLLRLTAPTVKVGEASNKKSGGRSVREWSSFHQSSWSCIESWVPSAQICPISRFHFQLTP